MITLKEITTQLEANPAVDAVFLTGSFAQGTSSPSSDMDLVVILKENNKQIRSVYTWIDGVFADIFFFDHANIERIKNANKIASSSPELESSFVVWLSKSKIIFDKTGEITNLKTDTTLIEKCGVLENEKNSIAQRINYNRVANKRYFLSDDPHYHEALALRLLYSVSELVVGYLTLRGISWEGEKHAINYLKEESLDFYNFFLSFLNSKDLTSRYQAYESMCEKVFPPGYKWWTQEDVIVVPKDDSKIGEVQTFWSDLLYIG
jgi:predicted nucleotidyltransferase